MDLSWLWKWFKQLFISSPPNEKNRSKPNQLESSNSFILFLAIDGDSAEGIIDKVRDKKQLTQESVDILSRTANIEALWQSTEKEYKEKQIDQYFSNSPCKKKEYDLYLMKIKLNEPETEFYKSEPSTSRSRAFRRLLKKKHSVEVSQRLPRESINNNPHLYR